MIERAKKCGAFDAVVSNHWALGGAGAVDLAHAVMKASDEPVDFKFLYEVEQGIEEKIETIAREIYGADGIELSDLAKKKVETYTRQVCF